MANISKPINCEHFSICLHQCKTRGRISTFVLQFFSFFVLFLLNFNFVLFAVIFSY